MSWIKTISYEEADSKLKRSYDRVKGPNNNIDNVLLIHSLRPHTLIGHMTLYKSVLHNSANTLPKWYLESIGVYVSYLNKCNYCVEHHLAGFNRHINDDNRSLLFQKCIKNNSLKEFFDRKFYAGIKYAEKLSLDHSSISKSDIDELRDVGFNDGEILEVNQVTSYFNYVNRLVVGLGVNTEGDIIGLSPSDSSDPLNWSHK